MIIEFEKDASEKAVIKACARVKDMGYRPTEIKTQKSHYLVAIGSEVIDIREIGHTAGVKDVHRVSDSYKLVSRKWKVDPTIIELGDKAAIREGELSIIAGPCSIESREQVEKVAEFLIKEGLKIMRGGAFKPRTSPYSFRGLGGDALRIMNDCARKKGLKIVSEVLNTSQIDEMYDYIDVFQIGTRNTQNFSLLHALGKTDKPVLIKRGMSGTIDELLQSAEYVFASGNEKLILCERGIRTFENAYRNTLDLTAVPVLKEKSHLPVIVDPSHGVGIRRHVPTMALTAIIAGADGIMVEIHPEPKKALSDAYQTLDLREAARLIANSRKAFNFRRQVER